MDAAYQQIALVNNATAHRFEMKVGDAMAMIAYMLTPTKITLTHTEVDESLEGKGAGTAVVEKVLHYIEDHHLKLEPLCPFVVTYLKRHPEWNRLVNA